jgi:hypothetical protein
MMRTPMFLKEMRDLMPIIEKSVRSIETKIDFIEKY